MMSNRMSHSFHPVDYLMFGGTLLIPLAIGIYYGCSGGKQKTISEYLVGDRKMKVLPVAFSLLVSFESSIMMLGYPAEMYVYGTMYWWTAVAAIISCIIAVYIVAPLFHPLQVTSGYEYLGNRFKSKAIRITASALGIMANLWYMGIVLYGPATALEAVSGFPVWASVVLVSIAAIVYTSIGGLKAVIWADVVQFLIMVAGILSVIIKGFMMTGGVRNVIEICDKGNRLQFFDFNLDPTVRHTTWALIIGNTVRILNYHYFQASVQRISAMKTLREAKLIIMITAPGYFLFSTLASVEGLISYAYFTQQRCDPLEAGYISNPNQVLPYLVFDLFQDNPGLTGLFLASLFSASLSSTSSCLNSISALVWRDFLQPIFQNASDLRGTIFAKASVVVFGVLSVGVCFLIMKVGGTITQVCASMTSSFAGPLTGLFLLGSLFPCANKKGAIVGALSGCIISLWISMGSSFSTYGKQVQPWLPRAGVSGCTFNSSNIFENSTTVEYNVTTDGHVESSTMQEQSHDAAYWFYSLSYLWFGMIGTTLVLTIGVAVSLCTGSNKDDPVEEKYILPVCSCILRSYRERLCCTDTNVKPNKKNEENNTDAYDTELLPTTNVPKDTELRERMLENHTDY